MKRVRIGRERGRRKRRRSWRRSWRKGEDDEGCRCTF